MSKKMSMLLTLCLLLVGVGGCTPQENTKGTIGVLLPTRYMQRWNKDAQYLQENIKNAGYEMELLFAEDDINLQIGQMENLIAQDVDVIIACPIDGYTLSGAIARAVESGIQVISHDRLIMGTQDLSGYTSFDSVAVGKAHGQYLVDTLGIGEGAEPCVIELFAGDPGDNNATYFFEGSMSVLRPYIDQGLIVVKSKQLERLQVAAYGWSTEKAQARMDDLLTTHYADGTKLDGILCPSDNLAMGIIASLKNIGYGSADKPMPIITGQNGDVSALIAIENGDLSMTVFKNPKDLVERSVALAVALLEGKEFAFNNTTDYFNGVVYVPTVLCDFTVVVKDNIDAVMVDSGYYTKEELKRG